jgi:hypothetical protein
VLTYSGKVESAPDLGGEWNTVESNQVLHVGYRIRTGKSSRATLKLSNLSVLRVFELTTLEIQAPKTAKNVASIDLRSGATYFFHRDQPGDVEFRTPAASGAIRGTEFNLAVGPDGRTELALLDGRVALSNAQGSLNLQSGEQAVVDPGGAPRKSPLINAVNIIQWTLYYPGVLNVDELELDPEAQRALAGSLTAYRAGDLLAALARFPAAGAPDSEAAQVYHAALLLAVGDVAKAEALLGSSVSQPRAAALADALKEMVAAVKHQTWPRTTPRTLSTEWLSGSYHEQSEGRLAEALNMAAKAAAAAPGFGFAQERLAEMEFSHGQTSRAVAALKTALADSPRNAKAIALQGFLLSARGRFKEAGNAFQQAIDIDGALSDAWLGRGLVRIRQGEVNAGREDLETAAALEPTRSFLRSYLGKAFAHEALFGGDPRTRQRERFLALDELDMAKKLDPSDPTPWLYSALILYNEYEIADSIDDLKESELLNGNRQVYRSQLLLDKDQAVRSANLADIYKDAGMLDVSLDEAARAVSYDYANFSAHLNLASTYDSLRDPTRFNLRYESEWFNETLLAGMLAPPGATSLSENLSQQEYSSLFSGNSVGLQETADVYSDKDYRQTASQYGYVDNVSWAFDLYYQYKAGIRVNNQLSQIDWDSHVKEQITPQDSLYIFTTYEDFSSGDQFQYYNQNEASPSYHFTEQQTPMLLAGWHHEWSPGSHTLFLAGRLEDEEQLSVTNAGQYTTVAHPYLPFYYTVPFGVGYSNTFVTYTADLNQILEGQDRTEIFGVRYQNGIFRAESAMTNENTNLPSYVSHSTADGRFQRLTPYVYQHWEILDGLMLIGGMDYDTEEYPADYRRPPLNSVELWKDHWSPKGALIWSPTPTLTLRGVFSRALGGVSYDESVRLEPTQLAGFDQSFRSIISESFIGSSEAGEYQVIGGALDWRLLPRTWLTMQGQFLQEKVEEESGYFSFNFAGNNGLGSFSSGNNITQYDYRENTAALALNHILEDHIFLQAKYQFSLSDLRTNLPPLPTGSNALAQAPMDGWGSLQQAQLSASWLDPRGFFSRAEWNWYGQALGGMDANLPGDRFSQINLYAGYRFRNRRGAILVGVLNLTGGGYHLSPINYYLDLPYQRLAYTRVQFNF